MTCQSFLTLLQKERKKECRFFRVKNFDTNTDGITELSIFSSSGHPIQNQRVRFSWIYIWLLYIASVLRVLTRTRSSILNVLKGLQGRSRQALWWRWIQGQEKGEKGVSPISLPIVPCAKLSRTFPANLLKKSREEWGRSYLERGRESNFFIARGRGWEDIRGDHIVFNGRRRGNICP